MMENHLKSYKDRMIEGPNDELVENHANFQKTLCHFVLQFSNSPTPPRIYYQKKVLDLKFVRMHVPVLFIYTIIFLFGFRIWGDFLPYFHPSVTPSFLHFAILSFSHSVILAFCCFVIPPFWLLGSPLKKYLLIQFVKYPKVGELNTVQL